MRLQRAPVFHRRLDGEALLDLAEIDEILKALRKAEIAQHGLRDARIAAGILLVPLHDRRDDVQIVFASGEAADHGAGRERLEAELRAEARAHVAEVLEVA